ncbi:MAG TPA: ABC transporter ATP-binding protein [Syntrophomonas sp.]|nr:ABC transporter ATP-binding protein [Syntrophomonas sp.]
MKYDPLISVRNLSITYYRDNTSISGINFSISKGKVLGLAGESGSGKSSICKAILGLLHPGLTSVSGEIRFMGKNILSMSYEERRKINGKDIAFVMQNPMAAFDPCMKIKHHFSETLTAHLMCSKKDALHYAAEMLHRVGLSDVGRIMDSYPYMVSGGMLQKVMLAIAVSLNPALIVADEPTTALDAESQSVILSLLQNIMREYRPAMLYVSHDMRILSLLSDNIAVMKDGHVIEMGCTKNVFENPEKRYTRELIAACSLMQEVASC